MLLKEFKELYEEKKKDREDSIANGVLSEFLNGEFTMLEKIIYRMENKRKPLSDGTLPLTQEEMSELCEIMGYQNICKIFYDNKLHFKCFDKGWGIITDVKAIAYLLERFHYDGENE
ncbi:MAG: hypothetical protein RBS96_02170 [Dehalococcoidales bacterium]|jgi:hypothetical protein|nr:hypothetical protein [Dehalococcoidales bacterium]